MNRWHSLQTALLAIVLAGTAHAAAPQDDLTAACQRGDLASAQRLLKKGATINGRDREDRTPLLCAVFSKKAELIEWLLRNGADANAEGQCPEANCQGHPALPLATHLGEMHIAKLLIAAKADVSWKDNYLARHANLDNEVELLKMLRAAGGRETGAPVEAKPKPRSNAAIGVSELLPATAVPKAAPGEKLRVAIVADETLATPVDLLTTALTGKQFQLVERAELNRVLAEHKLTADFGADRTRAADLGALLGADALVLLRKVKLGETDSLEMRFVRVSPGIVIDSACRAWPLADASAWAGDAAARLAALDPKIRDTRAIAVATAPFRPLTDTVTSSLLARETSLLLNDRLARQPGIVLLEREAVDALSREQSIGKAGGFWAGSYLLDGTVEPPASDAGQTAITLRLAPIGPGEVKTFTARGPRTELPRLIADLTAQAADALKLRAVPPSDLKAEAQRHYDESRNLFAVGLLAAAHRAAETAAVFGLDTDEFNEWRLDTASRLIAWQVERFGGHTMLHGVRLNGWNEAWVEERMVGAEWLRPVEWCDLGVEAVRLWQRLLVSALRSDDATRAAGFLDKDKSPVTKAFSVHESLNLAATTLDHGDMHLAIPDTIRETLEQALKLADARPAQAANACKIVIELALRAPELYRDKASLIAGFTPLLTRDFATENTATRVAIRQSLFRMNDYKSTSHVPSCLLAMREVASRGASVDAEITRAAFECLLPKDKTQQPALADKLFDLFWQRRQMFVDAPPTIHFFEQLCTLVSKHVRDAPKFRERWVQQSDRQVHEFSPEMRDLRRKIFLLVAKDAEHPAPARRLFDKDYHPDGEDAAEIAALSKRVQDADSAEIFAAIRRPATSNTAVQTPRPVLRTTPTYANHPPFKVARRWTTEPTPHGPVKDFYISAPTFDVGANTLWLFGQLTDDNAVHSCAFEVSLPSLKTRTWPLPDHKRINGSRDAHFFLTPDIIYLLKDGAFLATGDRKTRDWKLNREVQPNTEPVRVGDELFFLTASGGARGMSALSLRDQTITVLASNRRTPPQTPLDRPDVAGLYLTAGASGIVEITTEPFDATEGFNTATKPQSLATYDPAKRVWTEPRLIETTAAGPRGIPPIVAPGVPQAYKKVPTSNVWTLQLPRAEMPKIRIPIEFVEPDGAEPDKPDPMADSLYTRWYWAPQGYIATVSRPFTGSIVYFIPQAELDAYLDAHVPGEDETGGGPPAPTKP